MKQEEKKRKTLGGITKPGTGGDNQRYSVKSVFKQDGTCSYMFSQSKIQGKAPPGISHGQADRAAHLLGDNVCFCKSIR